MDQDQRGDQRRLAVLPSDRQDRAADAPAPIPAPAVMRLVDIANEPPLERPQLEQPAGAFAGWDGQLLDEGDYAVGSLADPTIALR